MSRLSPQQQHILVHVYQTVQDPAPGEQGVMAWGVDGDGSFRASTSRSLRRLERHGLVHRLHRTAGRPRESPGTCRHRTTHIRLTASGLALARRLIAAGGGGC
jgi:hypothetical protein